MGFIHGEKRSGLNRERERSKIGALLFIHTPTSLAHYCDPANGHPLGAHRA